MVLLHVAQQHQIDFNFQIFSKRNQCKFLRHENLLAACYHDNREIYFLRTILTIEQVLVLKSNKEGRPMLGLVRYYKKIWGP